MRLGELLSRQAPDALARLARGHIDEAEKLSPALLAGTLEGIIRSYSYIQQAVVRRQPPVLAILSELAKAPGHERGMEELRQLAMSRTELFCRRVETGEILAKDDQFQLYRRVLAEAWRSGLDINGSEATLLGVLRHEVGMNQIDHFLVWHHPDLQLFWSEGDPFSRELNGLNEAGLVFLSGDRIYLPDELASPVIRSMGIFLSEDASRRLCGWLSIHELEAALQLADLKTSGSKALKIGRLVENFIPPQDVLNNVNLADLRELARRVECTAYGSKDELIERLIAHFEAGLDVPQPEEAPTPPAPEARELSERDFRRMFDTLRGNELAEILSHFPELRQSGSKETRGSSLWGSHRAEVSLLATLSNRRLGDILERCDVKLGGSKSERVRRLIDHFRVALEGPVA